MQGLQKLLENSQEKIQSQVDNNKLKISKWDCFLKEVKKICSSTAYKNWIEPIKVVKENEKEIELSVPNLFVKEYLCSNYGKEMKEIFSKNEESQIAVTFKISTPITPNYISFREPNEEYFFKKVGKKYAEKAFLHTCNPEIISSDLIKWGYEWAKNPNSIFIHGGIGSGKTHFCIAIIRQAFKERKIYDSEFFVGTTLDSEGLDAIKSDSGDKEFLKKIKNIEFLFIDDFGRETRSERLSRQYFDIINHRYANELPTIISSNLDLNGVANRCEEAIASRMQEWQIIHMKGRDARSFI